jgi:hypothetical protein
VFSGTTYTNPLTLYQPLDFSNDTTLSVGKFFKAADMKILFEIGFDFESWNCSRYSNDQDNVKFYTTNPDMNITFSSTWDND